MKRKCEVCPAEVKAVCRHAFGKFWDVRSRGGEGCDHPLDAVAEAWAAAGWKPEMKQRQGFVGDPVSVPVAGGVITLSRPEDLREGGFAPRMPAMPRRPTRPKVSAEIMRQAELFFGRAKK